MVGFRSHAGDDIITKLLAANNQWNMSTNYIVMHRKKKHKSISKENYVLEQSHDVKLISNCHKSIDKFQTTCRNGLIIH